jgi:hypothetical protein
MPTKSEVQRRLIFGKRNQYKNKDNTPIKWKWIWDSHWENKGKLPEKITEQIKSIVREVIKEIEYNSNQEREMKVEFEKIANDAFIHKGSEFQDQLARLIIKTLNKFEELVWPEYNKEEKNILKKVIKESVDIVIEKDF